MPFYDFPALTISQKLKFATQKSVFLKEPHISP